MKLTCITILFFILTGCIKKPVIEFTGITPGIKNGVFIIKTKADSEIYGENIKDGKFVIVKKQLKYPDYYLFNIIDSEHPDNRTPFEIYLESGHYTIKTQPGKLYQYPKITTTSATQNELSAYYTLSDQLIAAAQETIRLLNNEVASNGNQLSKNAYNALLNQLSNTENKLSSIALVTFKRFVNEHPHSVASAHIMSALNYEDDPVAYYAVYKILSPAVKNSDEGKEIGDRLSHLVKLIAGAKAPAIIGKMPDGKPFDPASMHKKLILIDFWRAGNDFSRQNHQKLVGLLNQMENKNSLGIVSVSLDTKQKWWLTAIAGDNLTWPQVSDLKGDDSSNAVNWAITTIPSYYLVDGKWNIVERNVPISNIGLEISGYLDKHP